jgi:hypothetical protein
MMFEVMLLGISVASAIVIGFVRRKEGEVFHPRDALGGAIVTMAIVFVLLQGTWLVVLAHGADQAGAAPKPTLADYIRKYVDTFDQDPKKVERFVAHIRTHGPVGIRREDGSYQVWWWTNTMQGYDSMKGRDASKLPGIP